MKACSLKYRIEDINVLEIQDVPVRLVVIDLRLSQMLQEIRLKQ